MAGELLLDTGALVSLLDRSQTHHLKCRRAFADWTGSLVSTEAVLTEATHLLAGVRGGRAACVDFFVSGGALLVPSTMTSLQRVRKLLDKYADLPMDFADATLVALAEGSIAHPSSRRIERTSRSIGSKAASPFVWCRTIDQGNGCVPGVFAGRVMSRANNSLFRFLRHGLFAIRAVPALGLASSLPVFEPVCGDLSLRFLERDILIHAHVIPQVVLKAVFVAETGSLPTHVAR